MSLEASFGIGDYVEILESHGQEEEAGNRGYILRPHEDDEAAEVAAADTHFFDVVIDEARFEPPPNEDDEAILTFGIPARVVVVPAQCLKLVRGHEEDQVISMKDYMDAEYPCLGMAATSYKVCRINPESPHGKLARPPARDLPGPHSCDRTFANAEVEGLSSQLYNGDFVFRWTHSFVPTQGERHELDIVALERAAPYLLIAACPGTTADNIGPLVMLNAAVAQDSFSCGSQFDLTESQKKAWATRALHYFLRVAGCDVGQSSHMLERALAADYLRKAWWKENLDAAIIMADIAVQTGMPVDLLVNTAKTLGNALSCCKKYGQAAEMYEMIRTDYAYKLPRRTSYVTLLCRQATAYFSNENYDKAEATVLHGFRELFSVYGVEGGLTKYEFEANVTLLLASYGRQAFSAESTGAGQSTKFMELTLKAMFSVSNLHDKCDVGMISALKPKFRKKAVARKALLKALQTNSVEEFHAAVSSCAVDPRRFKFDEVQCNSMVVAQELKRRVTESTRSTIRTLTQEAGSLCDNPSCTQENELLDKPSRCSRCKAAFYCSRACQVAHWKEHKQSCSSRGK